MSCVSKCVKVCAGRRLRGGRARLDSRSLRVFDIDDEFTEIFTPDMFTVRDSRKYSTRHASIGDFVFRPFFSPFAFVLMAFVCLFLPDRSRV